MASERNPEVVAMVKQQLARRNPPSTAVLYVRAKRIDPSIGELSLRQFNARYPLQVKRQQARAERRKVDGRKGERRPREARQGAGVGKKAGVAKKTTADERRTARPDREKIRQVLLDYARQIAAARSQADVIDAVASVDESVDRILEAFGRS